MFLGHLVGLRMQRDIQGKGIPAKQQSQEAHQRKLLPSEKQPIDDEPQRPRQEEGKGQPQVGENQEILGRYTVRIGRRDKEQRP